MPGMPAINPAVNDAYFCLDHETRSDSNSSSANSHSRDLTLNEQDFTARGLDPHDPLQLAEDEIIVQDKGRYRRKHAWFFLVLGNNVSDHAYKPLTVEVLEKEMDPTGQKGSVYCRRRLWKTVPPQYWFASNQHTQPGMTYNEKCTKETLHPE